jgi:hypothetical protein
MKRRDVLTTTATIVFAGCLGDGIDGSGTSTDSIATATTGKSSATATETPADGTVEPTATDAGAGTPLTKSTPTSTTSPTTTPTESVSATATGTTDTAIPVPDRLTDHRKDTPLAGEAQVTFKNGGSRIVVAGTIVGNNGCQKPVLDSVRETKSGLVITIATKRDAPTNAACSMALVELVYRFPVIVEKPPKSVTVVHRGMGGKRTITTAKPSG